jgi:hypothetical protein
MSFETFNHSIAHTIQSYIYMAQFPLFFSPLASSPFAPPLCPLLLTWHSPAVTGIVHLSLRLLVNWPHSPHPSPNYPTPSKFPTPTVWRQTTTTSGIFRFLLSGTSGSNRHFTVRHDVSTDQIVFCCWHNANQATFTPGIEKSTIFLWFIRQTPQTWCPDEQTAKNLLYTTFCCRNISSQISSRTCSQRSSVIYVICENLS